MSTSYPVLCPQVFWTDTLIFALGILGFLSDLVDGATFNPNAFMFFVNLKKLA